MFKLHDHWRAILVIVAVLAGLLIFLSVIKGYIAQNPGIVNSVKQFSQTDGLPTSVFIAFVGSLWFIPFPYEILVVPIIKFYNPLIVALLGVSVGATLSDVVNFYTGKFVGQRYILKRLEKKTVTKIQAFFTKYGVATLVIFTFITPVTSYDIVAFFIGGFSKMEFKTFLPVTFACRVLHFIFAIFLADVLLKIVGLSL